MYNVRDRSMIAFDFLLVFAIAAIVIPAAIAMMVFRPWGDDIYHVTCPGGVYDGIVIHKGTTDYELDAETGNRLLLPDGCVWEEIDRTPASGDGAP